MVGDFHDMDLHIKNHYNKVDNLCPRAAQRASAYHNGPCRHCDKGYMRRQRFRDVSAIARLVWAGQRQTMTAMLMGRVRLKVGDNKFLEQLAERKFDMSEYDSGGYRQVAWVGDDEVADHGDEPSDVPLRVHAYRRFGEPSADENLRAEKLMQNFELACASAVSVSRRVRAQGRRTMGKRAQEIGALHRTRGKGKGKPNETGKGKCMATVIRRWQAKGEDTPKVLQLRPDRALCKSSPASSSAASSKPLGEDEDYYNEQENAYDEEWYD